MEMGELFEALQKSLPHLRGRDFCDDDGGNTADERNECAVEQHCCVSLDICNTKIPDDRNTSPLCLDLSRILLPFSGGGWVWVWGFHFDEMKQMPVNNKTLPFPFHSPF